jgi:hypothetical protein
MQPITNSQSEVMIQLSQCFSSLDFSAVRDRHQGYLWTIVHSSIMTLYEGDGAAALLLIAEP